MNVFAVVALKPESVPAITTALAQKFPGNFLEASDRLWFVSHGGTTAEFSLNLGVKSTSGGDITHVVILPVTTYWGNATPSIWEWLKNRMEAKS
jgi:hypothetical protein